jgi:hypothetical protein
METWQDAETCVIDCEPIAPERVIYAAPVSNMIVRNPHPVASAPEPWY